VREVSRVLVALDATEEAVNYAAANGFDTVLVHHPLIFSPLGSVTPEENVPRKVIFSLMNEISVISLHTRLDAGEGGVNDCLASALGLTVTGKFGDSESPECGRIAALDAEMSIERFAEYVKERLSAPAVVLSAVGDETVRHVALIGGGGKDFIIPAKEAGADVLVTGEASYNDMLDAAENGIPVIAAGHYRTEVVVCERLAALARDVADAECEIFTYTPVKVI
jgi:dinuclear metal center YbgI/SA1388 family protein